MGKKSKTSVLKRQRERKKAEKAALKRELRGTREPEGARSPEDLVATRDDLVGYGMAEEEEEEDEAVED